MQHDEFIATIQERAQLASRGDAERATRATLETLGERIPGGLAANLAAQLPIEIGEHLRRTLPYGATDAPAERFDADEFVARVASRSTTDEPVAAYRARVVFEVVDEATEGGVAQKVAETLPDDIRRLVTAGSTGGV
ncbi:DUF2267 domain-containing protein [Jiangella aurantiaca]|uniref:DUF2267 domain-containing protein n=1 Tax=Jiangella aurantiaca TaxID=2530373 RepID=A0A4R5A171_9ACTN|nr:DUF2267 domain-containing protein [Jiangella aurantiaca]TDD65461.1 DUF2267 domain-containing protein [Jiangella aurantiaca]